MDMIRNAAKLLIHSLEQDVSVIMQFSVQNVIYQH